MGNKPTEPIEEVNRDSFDFLSVIGKGGFGKVWKVRHKKNYQEFAMKEMSKALIIEKNCVSSILYERDLLSNFRHPFIINMMYSFQDKDNLYLVMNLVTGGDLRYQMTKMQTFTESQSKFLISCLILGLEAIHANDIIHRDIKPENLVLDYKGYLKITDFGIAKKKDNQNLSENSGTPGYMAPEVMSYQNHSFTVDYYAVGIICYELMMGVRPYTGENKNIIKEKILAKQVMIKNHEIPNGWSKEAADFINNLIQRKPNSRLGYKGIHEIKHHKWFADLNWKDLYNMKIEAPFIPPDEENYDIKYLSREDIIDNDEQEKLEKIKLTNEYINGFKNYLYFNFCYENNKKSEFINPHKIYEEINKKENKENNDNNKYNEISNIEQRCKELKIPELSPECKEIVKYNLFGTNNGHIKLTANLLYVEKVN